MAIMTALAFLVASAAPVAPVAGSAVSPGPAITTYGPMPNGTDPAPQSSRRDCGPGNGSDILVCARQSDQKQRLPLRDERAEPGEVVHHPSEPPPAAAALNDKPQCQYNCGPSPAAENWGRLFRILKGEDPDD